MYLVLTCEPPTCPEVGVLGSAWPWGVHTQRSQRGPGLEMPHGPGNRGSSAGNSLAAHTAIATSPHGPSQDTGQGGQCRAICRRRGKLWPLCPCSTAVLAPRVLLVGAPCKGRRPSPHGPVLHPVTHLSTWSRGLGGGTHSPW